MCWLSSQFSVACCSFLVHRETQLKCYLIPVSWRASLVLSWHKLKFESYQIVFLVGLGHTRKQPVVVCAPKYFFPKMSIVLLQIILRNEHPLANFVKIFLFLVFFPHKRVQGFWMCSASWQNKLEMRTARCGWFSSLELPRQLAADVVAELESPESWSGVAAPTLSCLSALWELQGHAWTPFSFPMWVKAEPFFGNRGIILTVLLEQLLHWYSSVIPLITLWFLVHPLAWLEGVLSGISWTERQSLFIKMSLKRGWRKQKNEDLRCVH